MSRKTTAFTLIELLVVISIIALLIGILLPALGAARNTARDLKCLANQRQAGIGLHAYASEYDQTLPPAFDNQNYGNGGTGWSVLITAYLEGNANFDFSTLEQRNELFQCPQAAVSEGRLHYGANAWVLPVAFSPVGYRGGVLATKLYNIDWEKRASDVMWIADAGQFTQNSGPDLGDSFAAIDFLNQGNGGYRFFSAADTDNTDVIDEGPNSDGPTQAAASNLRWRHGSGGKESGSDGGAVNFLFGDGHASSNVRGSVMNQNVRPAVSGG